MGVLFALASAVCYGFADYLGGILSRRAGSTSIAFTGQLGGLILCVAAAMFIPAPAVGVADLIWGAQSGVGTGAAMLFLYRGLSRGDMSVVVPLSAVGGLALPVLFGVAVLSNRPSMVAWIGIILAVPSLWLIGRARQGPGRVRAAGSSDAMLAGLGIALQYLALAQAGAGSGAWPVAAGRLAAVITLAPIVIRGGGWRLPPPVWLKAAGTGGIAALALFCYLIATRHDLVSIAVVLSSLYPAIPVVLGIVILRERISRRQLLGLIGSGIAIGCLAS